MFQGGQADEGLAFAKSGHGAARRPLPAREGGKKSAGVTPRYPRRTKGRDHMPLTQLAGATAAVLSYDAVSRVMAAIEAGGPRVQTAYKSSRI